MNINRINISNISSKSLKERKYADVFPEYYELKKIVENNLWHNNQNVLDHVTRVFEELESILKFDSLSSDQKNFLQKYLSVTVGKRTRNEILIVATLLHDIAKTDTFIKQADGTAYCPGHDLLGSEKVKLFSDRFDLGKNDEEKVKRIIKYHYYTSEIINSMIIKGNEEKYLKEFINTVGDIAIELILLMQADLFGSDLEKNDKKSFDDSVRLLEWMLKNI